MLRPVLPQVSGQLLDCYSVDPRCTLVSLNPLQRFSHVLRFTYLLHQPLARSSAFRLLFRNEQFGPFAVRRSFTPRLRHEGQFVLVLLPPSAHRSLRLTRIPIYPFLLEGDRSGLPQQRPVLRPPAVSPLSGECPDRADRLLLATSPSADFWIVVRVSLDSLSPLLSRTQSRSPEVSTTAFRTQPPNLRRTRLMDMDFAVIGQLVPLPPPVFGFCPSARAFARRFLQTPSRDGRPCALLPFTSIRLVEDFHFQAVVQCSAHLN